MRRFILVFLVLILAACLAAGVEENALAAKLVRLHVIANSDSDADQQLKLELRDALLAASPEIFERAKNSEELVHELENCARRELERLGSDSTVRVELGQENYDTRDYATFSLPAGEYCSLRVTLGEGAGQNWWCVLFPPLCFTTGQEFRDAADQAGLSEDEMSLITGGDGGFEIRFRIIELLEKLAGLLK